MSQEERIRGKGKYKEKENMRKDLFVLCRTVSAASYKNKYLEKV